MASLKHAWWLHAGRSGKDGSSLNRTTSAVPRVSFGNPRASMDMQLPAVYISDEKGYLSPMGPGRNPRRSVDTPSHFKPVFNPTPAPREAEEGSVRGGDVQLASRNPSTSLGKEEAAKVTKQRAAQALVEKKTPRRPSASNDLQTVAVPSKNLDFAGMKKPMLYLNPAFGDTGGRGQEKISTPRIGRTQCSRTRHFFDCMALMLSQACSHQSALQQNCKKKKKKKSFTSVGGPFLSWFVLVTLLKAVRPQLALHCSADCCC